MPLLRKSARRAESARINGAKSKGPKTPEGLHRSRTASYKHGLYAVRNYMMPGESVAEFAELQSQMLAYWQPKGFYEELLVHELVGNLWEAKRAQAGKNDFLHDQLITVMKNAPHCHDQAKLNLEAEKLASAAGGSMDRFNARLAHFSRERHRLERELLRLEKRPCTSAPSQMSLIINGRQNPEIPATADAHPLDGTLAEAPYIVEAGTAPLPESFSQPAPENTPDPEPPGILAWAKDQLDFHPDEIQKQILTETNKRIIVLAPRQSGKSTAAAVRVIHEAVHHPDSTVLLASASGRQSGQILQKARQLARRLDLELFGPPAQCDGFTLANGASIIALPDSEETIRGFSAPRLIVVDEAAFASPELFKALEPMLTVSNGTLMLLSTPNGQTGYFYDQWHLQNTPWTRIFGTIEDCPRVSAEAIEQIRQSMSEEDFKQEFECKFIAAGGQFISLETYRKCLRDDFDLFCPEWENED